LKVEEKIAPTVQDIVEANTRIGRIITETPLMPNQHMSDTYGCEVTLKREDLQVVRSYKIRGAFNKISHLAADELNNGVVCASAGNHAQGVAFACCSLQIHGTIFMPTPTPRQKINQVRGYGKDYVEIVLTGDTFDDAYKEALEFSNQKGSTFIHPFNDPYVIAGQGTVGLEILNQARSKIDYLILPVGGGGLASGIATYFKTLSPNTKLIGVEPEGAPAMKASLEQDQLVTLDQIDLFVDGAAVKTVGDLTFEICRDLLDDVITVPEGKICTTILRCYNEDAIVLEPAGALSIAALDVLKDKLTGKNVTCVVSGGNNDITRTEEIKERSLLYEGLKHYFIVSFPQRAGALREFLVEVLGPTDDITHFEYSKKNSRERGPAVIGVELKESNDLKGFFSRMKKKGFQYEYLNENPELFHFII